MIDLTKTLENEDLDTCPDDTPVIKNENKKSSRVRKNIHNYFRDFCKRTRIYGFSYLGESNRFKFEKFYWLIFICLSIYLSTHLSILLWSKWNQLPQVITTHKWKSIFEIPFPAITICPETKIRQSLYNYTENYHRAQRNNLTSEEFRVFSDLSILCDKHLESSGNKSVNLDNIVKTAAKYGPTILDVLFVCKWSGRSERCDHLFTPILTDDGYCFTFNLLDKRELYKKKTIYFQGDSHTENFTHGWTPEHGYVKNFKSNVYPRRTPSIGSLGTLFLLLKDYGSDFDYICRGADSGFKVLLHSPNEIPRAENHYLRASHNHVLSLTVKPEMVVTSPELRSYDPQERQCFFQNERQLKFFQNYNKQNCWSECTANFTLTKCGCVSFYMPHENSTHICGTSSNLCILKAHQELIIRESRPDLENLCNCLPSCTSLTYHVEPSQSDFSWRETFGAFRLDHKKELPGIQLTRIAVSFKDMHFTVTERIKLHNNTELLALLGGLLAFFSGFSFLSIVEIIYFVSLRLFSNVRRFGKHYWGGVNVEFNE